VTADEDKTVEDARREAEAWFGPGGPGEFVGQFLGELWAGHYAEAAARLDPEYGPADLFQLGQELEFIKDPGWGWSSAPRITPEGDEIVRRVYIEGPEGWRLIDNPMVVPGVDFVVRHGSAGWSLVRIEHHTGPSAPR
jgi:hypothetical protein